MTNDSQHWVQNRLSGFVSGLSCLWLAATLFWVWVDPMAWDDGHWVRFGVGILIIEFLALHSSVFITNLIASAETSSQKLKYGLGFFVFYSLMAFGIAAGVGSYSLVAILGAMMLARTFAAFAQDPATLAHTNARSALGITLYILLCGATVFIDIPEMGITNSVLAEVYPNRGGGVWERHPERAIVAAAIYFGIMGLVEIYWSLTDKSQTAEFRIAEPKASR